MIIVYIRVFLSFTNYKRDSTFAFPGHYACSKINRTYHMNCSFTSLEFSGSIIHHYVTFKCSLGQLCYCKSGIVEVIAVGTRDLSFYPASQLHEHGI